MKLPLNATLIEQKPVKGSEFLSIILCKIDKGEYNSEFVTWVYNHEFEGCVSGHYYPDIVQAVNDFKDRT